MNAAEQMLAHLKDRVRGLDKRAEQCRSGRSRMKARVRANEAALILGELREINAGELREINAKACIFECRSENGSMLGTGRAWCQSHGFDCPKLRGVAP